MQNNTVQLRVTLPAELQAYLQAKANKFGLNMSAYVKNLIINDVKDVDMPVFKMSKQTEEVALQALKEHNEQKTHPINDVDEFLDNL